MPAESKKQQRFMGMVHAVQKGDTKAPSREVAEVAKSMKPSDAKDFAETSHKGLPEKKASFKRTMTLAILRVAATPGEKQASQAGLLKVARLFDSGTPLIPAVRQIYPKLTEKQAADACRLLLRLGLKKAMCGSSHKARVKKKLKKKAADPAAASSIVDMETAGGRMADYLTPAFWGGERAGRTQAMANAIGDETTFGVRHPLTSTLLYTLGGGGLGALAGQGIGSALSGGDPATAAGVSGLGGLAGTLGGAILAARNRRKEMKRVNEAYDEARSQGSVNPKHPEFSSLSAALLPLRGPHRVGQLEATRAIQGRDSVRNQHGTLRDVLYSLGLAGPPIVQLGHGYGQNLRTQASGPGSKPRGSKKKKEKQSMDAGGNNAAMSYSGAAAAPSVSFNGPRQAGMRQLNKLAAEKLANMGRALVEAAKGRQPNPMAPVSRLPKTPSSAVPSTAANATAEMPQPPGLKELLNSILQHPDAKIRYGVPLAALATGGAGIYGLSKMMRGRDDERQPAPYPMYPPQYMPPMLPGGAPSPTVNLRMM